MKTLYLECNMGAAGDMLASALLELLPEANSFVEKMNALGIPGVKIERENSVKCGITGTHLNVTVNGEEEVSEDVHDDEYGHEHEHEYSHEHDHENGNEHDHKNGHAHNHDHAHDYEHDCEYDHEHTHEHGHAHAHHHHTSLADIETLVAGLPVPEAVRADIFAVYGLIAEAESHAHGVPVSEIHFHEVGTMDAVADITMVCLLMHELGLERVVVSPVATGYGEVKCAHGILPVPAPATAHLLQGIPTYAGHVRGELCTPTGAALLKHFATEFGNMPVMRTERIGYGMGKKDFETANCVRAILGETGGAADEVCELSCNVDDMTAEAIAFAVERFFEAGAVEAYTIPIGMKKSRPGTLICVMCRKADRDRMTRLIFQHTTTIGIREKVSNRYILEREMQTVETPYGPVRRKISRGYGTDKSKYEYEDLARIARAEGVSLARAAELVSDFDERYTDARGPELTGKEMKNPGDSSGEKETAEKNSSKGGKTHTERISSESGISEAEKNSAEERESEQIESPMKKTKDVTEEHLPEKETAGSKSSDSGKSENNYEEGKQKEKEEKLHEKYRALQAYLRKCGSAVIAFSGGVDSTFLLKAAHDALGDSVLAVTAASPLFPERELDEAEEFCRKEGIRQITFPSNEMEIEGFTENPKNRCYLCKRALFDEIMKIAAEHGIAHVCEGSNLDDEGDYRPGLQAIRELGIESPLRTCGFTKTEIRTLSKEQSLPTWDKQSFACLATRFVYGETISEERLRMVDRAEQLLLDQGFRQVRVRIHGDMARIEVSPDEIGKLLEETIRRKIEKELRNYGFSYVTVDLKGYRTGSMNQGIAEASEAPENENERCSESHDEKSGEASDKNPYKPMTEEGLLMKLEQTGKHAMEGNYRDADEVVSDLRKRYGL